MSNFQSYFKNILAVFFGIFICIAVIAFVEQFLKWNERTLETRVYVLYKPFPYYIKDRFGVGKAMPGQYLVQKVKEVLDLGHKEFIYNVNYTINQFGHRKTPIDKSKTRNKHIIFFGGSFTFGEGLNDNETIPYYFARQATDYDPYNFGFHGDGPFDILAKAENYQFDKILKHKKGIIVYILLNRHIFRVKGGMRGINWRKNRPFYKLVDGQIRRKGSFLTGRPILTLTLRLLYKSKIFKKLKIGPILPATDYDIKLTANTIKTTFNILEDKLPGFESYLLIYPEESKEPDYTKKILEYLDGTNITILDYSNLFIGSYSKYHIVGDGHPSAYSNKVLAEKLTDDLGLK